MEIKIKDIINGHLKELTNKEEKLFNDRCKEFKQTLKRVTDGIEKAGK